MSGFSQECLEVLLYHSVQDAVLGISALVRDRATISNSSARVRAVGRGDDHTQANARGMPWVRISD